MNIWAQYVSELTRGHRIEDVGKVAGVNGSTVSRWKRGESPAPRNPAVAAKLAVTYGGDVIEAFIAAGYLTAEEAGRKSERPLSGVSSKELIDEISDRLGVSTPEMVPLLPRVEEKESRSTS